MKKILVLFLLALTMLPAFSEDWFKINNTWEADRDSIIKTKKYYIVWLHNLKNNTYYYNQYKVNTSEKVVRQQQVLGIKTHYPYGKSFSPITDEDSLIIKAILDPSYVYKSLQIVNKSVNLNNLTALKVEHNIEYVFRTYVSDIQQKTETSFFYIDTKNKQIYRKNKIEVDYIKEFNDSEISFMIVDYTDRFKICRCYDIDRYTGNVVFTLFQHPLTLGAKFDHSMLDIKNGYVGQGKGTAIKVDVSKQKF